MATDIPSDLELFADWRVQLSTATVESDVDVGFADSPSQRAIEALEFLVAADIDMMDRGDLEAVIAARRHVVAFTDSIEVGVARRSRLLAEQGRSEPAREVLRERGRRSTREAAAAAGRERTCEQLPSFEPALANGTVSSGHLDVIANATARLDDDAKAKFNEHESELLNDAAESSVDAFERHCRDLARQVSCDDGSNDLERQRANNKVKQWTDKDTGMFHLHAELDPESGAKVSAALLARLKVIKHQQQTAAEALAGGDPSSSTMTYSQLEAQALIDLITGSGVLDRRTPEVIVLIDLDTLTDRLHDSSVSETASGVAMPPSTIRRLCCDADIVPAVLGGDGEVLDEGRAKRLATPAQRRAVFAMYSTCGFPGCRVPVDRCEIHHVSDWLRNGSTDLDNLLPVCSQHHHLIHEGRWNLALGDQRVVVVHRPDGSHHSTGRTVNRLAS